MAEAVVVSSLSRTFGDFRAVDRISFTVGTGEIFGFLGPNGAGKTTTIRMLTGLLAPTAGTAHVAGIDVTAAAAALRSRIGYMSQSFSLYGDLTVAENIELFAGLYGVRASRLRSRREWLLEMAGLAGRQGTVTSDLPLGYKQRLALGCATLHEPGVLFLDEPTSGVDPVARRAFWDLIHQLAAAGTTVLVSTHYMEEAEYCQRVILMNRGKLIAEGTPRQLRAGMTAPIYEITTDAAVRAVQALAASSRVEDAALFGRAVHVVMRTVTAGTDGGEDAGQVLGSLLHGAGLRFDSVRRVAPRLEDVFVARVREEGGAAVG
jgi:ABC-2 type transport system ATP-binding protein